MSIKGGGVPMPNGKFILNFHFDYLHPSLILVLGLFNLSVDTRNVNWMGGWVVSFSLRGCFLLQLSPSLYFQPTTSCVQSTFSHRANISQHRHRPVYFLAYRTRNLLSYREFAHFLVYFYRLK